MTKRIAASLVIPIAAEEVRRNRGAGKYIAETNVKSRKRPSGNMCFGMAAGNPHHIRFVAHAPSQVKSHLPEFIRTIGSLEDRISKILNDFLVLCSFRTADNCFMKEKFSGQYKLPWLLVPRVQSNLPRVKLQTLLLWLLRSQQLLSGINDFGTW